MKIFFAAGKNYRHPALLILRIVVGFGFMAHGWAKFSNGTSGFEKLLTTLQIPFPHFNSFLVPGIELLGGLAICLGALVVIVTAPLIATMLVALVTIHFKLGYSSVKTIGLNPSGPVFGPPGYEINILYIAALVIIGTIGPGPFSVDGMFKKHR